MEARCEQERFILKNALICPSAAEAIVLSSSLVFPVLLDLLASAYVTVVHQSETLTSYRITKEGRSYAYKAYPKLRLAQAIDR